MVLWSVIGVIGTVFLTLHNNYDGLISEGDLSDTCLQKTINMWKSQIHMLV